MCARPWPFGGANSNLSSHRDSPAAGTRRCLAGRCRCREPSAQNPPKTFRTPPSAPRQVLVLRCNHFDIGFTLLFYFIDQLVWYLNFNWPRYLYVFKEAYKVFRPKNSKSKHSISLLHVINDLILILVFWEFVSMSQSIYFSHRQFELESLIARQVVCKLANELCYKPPCHRYSLRFENYYLFMLIQRGVVFCALEYMFLEYVCHIMRVPFWKVYV